MKTSTRSSRAGRNRDNVRKHVSTIREAFREIDPGIRRHREHADARFSLGACHRMGAPKAGQSRPSPVGNQQSGKSHICW